MIDVYHLYDRKDHRPTIGLIGLEQARRILLNQDPGYIYLKVAIVAGEDLEDAFENTNHIDHDWRYNAGLNWVAPGKQRSTSMGDVMRDSNGDYYLVAMMGFEKISKESLM